MNSFENLLAYFKKDSLLHARFLNTVSLLEYIGARKILKSQQESDISATVLSHMSEEIRHAQIFKRVALKMSGGKLPTYDDRYLLAGRAARDYFQDLDHGIAAELEVPNGWLNYLYSTLLIEERAGKIYPSYIKFLTEAGFPGVLEAIVLEENEHLKDVYAFLEKDDAEKMEMRLIRMRALEERLFEAFMSQALTECQDPVQNGSTWTISPTA